MPELPELQAEAERLDERFAGTTLEGFTPISFTALKTVTPDPAAAVGSALRSVGRRGKFLLLGFEPLTFVVHLMQGGRLRPDDAGSKRPRKGLARWSFAGAGSLLLTEAGTEKRAGIWAVEGEPERTEPVARLGPDADQVSRAELAERLATSSSRLHGWLRDQGQLAGIGRRLANEVCHRAALSPFARADRLDDEQVQRLHDAIGACIVESLETERERTEMSKSAERPGAVHHRVGEACPVCGDVVRSVEYRSYTVAYCPTCQTGGRVLADNTTSRFLR